MPSLSVISPAYNGEDVILRFLESVARQTWTDYEFVIIDDASTDHTADLIKQFLPRLPGRVQFIRHEKNLGQVATIAEAFLKISGDICIKIDADSIIDPKTFEHVMAVFAANDQAGLVAFPIKSMDDSNWIVRGFELSIVAMHKNDFKDANDYTQVSGVCFAFRHSVFTEEELSTKIDADLSFLARKKGWKIVLREDTTVKTRFPTTATWAFARGRRLAWEAIPTFWHHKEKLLTRWGFWIKFTPLAIVLLLVVRPLWSLGVLLLWFLSNIIYLSIKAPEYPFMDRIAAWLVSVIRYSGFDYEIVVVILNWILKKLGIK